MTEQIEEQPTPAAEFRAMREKGVVQTLLSGRKVTVRTVTPDRLLRLGKIPDTLTPLMLKMLYGEQTQQDIDDFLSPRKSVDEALELVESLRIVCVAGLICPRVVDSVQAEDEILIEDLTPNERGWIFKLVFQSVEFLSTFRLKQTPDVELVPDSQNDRQPPQ